MINKEEIEKAKEYLKNYKYQNEVSNAIDIVLQYISELELENYEQNNIINNYIEERKEVEERLKLFLSEIKQDGIYGYDGDIQEILSILKGEIEDDK